jgi:stearoyl-CoA desaturase (delta-9 desaturase)
MGEGWHNNHHAAAGSAKTGMRPWEIDVSWMVISLMKTLRIVRRVSACTHEQLLERQKRGELVREMEKAA